MTSVEYIVLSFFRKEIPGCLDNHWKEIPLELDSDLFEAPGDNLHQALRKFEKKFNVDLSEVKWSCYIARSKDRI